MPNVTLCLDPGHGGADLGTSKWGLIESLYVFDFCQQLSGALTSYPLTWRFTRDIDQDPQFRERAAVSLGADFVLSVHVNANANTKFHALECYHLKGDELGRKVAEHIARNAPPELCATRARGGRVKVAYNDPTDPADDWLQHPQNVLRKHAAPSCLVELGYASNDADRNFLTSRWGKVLSVANVVSGILKAAELIERDRNA